MLAFKTTHLMPMQGDSRQLVSWIMLAFKAIHLTAASSHSFRGTPTQSSSVLHLTQSPLLWSPTFPPHHSSLPFPPPTPFKNVLRPQLAALQAHSCFPPRTSCLLLVVVPKGSDSRNLYMLFFFGSNPYTPLPERKGILQKKLLITDP